VSDTSPSSGTYLTLSDVALPDRLTAKAAGYLVDLQGRLPLPGSDPWAFDWPTHDQGPGSWLEAMLLGEPFNGLGWNVFCSANVEGEAS